MLLGLGFLCALAAIVLRLGALQINQHARYTISVLRQDTLSVPLEEVPRGLVLDRHCTLLSGGRAEQRVVVIPALVKDTGAVATGLARILNVPPAALAPYLDTPGYLPFPVSEEQRDRILRAAWSGVTVAPVSFRYGERPLATHVVGHLGKIKSYAELASLRKRSDKPYFADDLVGRSGIEKLYERQLKGSVASRQAVAYVDGTGKPLKGGGITVVGLPDRDRLDVVLTLDARIQSLVEELMDRHRLRGAVVVQDVVTGDLLAIASRPAYHPARVGDYLHNPDGVFTNRALTPYYPGSLFKIVVAAAGLAERVVKENDRFICLGGNAEPIRCWFTPGHGAITFAQAFAESCNPVFARVALEVGADRLTAYARRLGLEDQTILGYPETNVKVDLAAIGEPYNLVNAAVGQWPVRATPVQICTLVATIARDGVYRHPRLVKGLLRGDTLVHEIPSSPGKQVLEPTVARRLRELLALVTTAGQGRAAWVPGQGAAGKTGTAETGTAAQLAWFAGYTPLEKPRFAITVLVEGGESGSRSAAPLFREIATRLLGD